VALDEQEYVQEEKSLEEDEEVSLEFEKVGESEKDSEELSSR